MHSGKWEGMWHFLSLTQTDNTPSLPPQHGGFRANIRYSTCVLVGKVTPGFCMTFLFSIYLYGCRYCPILLNLLYLSYYSVLSHIPTSCLPDWCVDCGL